MSFVNFHNDILLCTTRSIAPLRRNELVCVNEMFDKAIQKKNPLMKH